MFYQKTLKLLSVLFTIVFLMSCASVDKKKETQRNPETFMWKLTSETATVYMLGSIHLGQKDMYPLHATIEKAYDESDYLVVEADISTDKMTELRALTMKYGMFTDGNSLQKVLSEKVYTQLDTELQSLGLSAAAFNSFKPWLVVLTLGAMKTSGMNLDAQLGIDMYFLNKAHETPKEVLELESVALQLSLFDSIPLNDQIKYLEQTMAQKPEESIEVLTKLVAAWKAADPKKMGEIIEKSSTENSLESVLFGKRDTDMAEKIIGYLATDKTYFVVVGAGHLAGSHSIIENLKKKGYKPVQQ